MGKRALEPKDRELIEIARGAIAPCYDGEEYCHTVGCGPRTGKYTAASTSTRYTEPAPSRSR